MDPPSRFTNPIRLFTDTQYNKRLFGDKLQDIGVPPIAMEAVLHRLGDLFTMTQLEQAIAAAREAAPEALQPEDAVHSIRWLARSNYQLELSREAEASEVVIFPQTSNESRGIEDLRMVPFVDMYSDIIHSWESAELLHAPAQAWEFVQVGNCGSPLETPEGWLLLTHGVGPMRTYCIGAMLLDLNDPLVVSLDRLLDRLVK